MVRNTWRASRAPRLALLVALVMTLLMAMAAIGQAGPPTVSTDQPDYPPGATAQITGSGFQAGETVQLQVIHYDETAPGGEGHDPWTVTADENGSFNTAWYVDPDDSAYSIFQLTADGQTSGLHAEYIFSDNPSSPKFPTTTTVSAGVGPWTAGNSVTISVQVSSSQGGQSSLNGKVTLSGVTATPTSLSVDNTGKAVFTTSPLPAGTYTIVATYEGDSNNISSSGSIALTVTPPSKTTPTITWSNPAAITFGTALGSTQLNATANVAGTFAYNPGSGTVLNAGTGQNLHVDFTPTDTNSYNGASADVKIDVNKASQTIAFGSLASKTYGDAPFTVSASASSSLPVSFSIVSGPASLSNNTVTITGVGTVKVRASQAGNSNYLPAADVDQSFTVSPATATVTLDAATLAQAYDGSRKVVTASTSPAGVAVQVTYAQKNQVVTSPTNAGSYDVTATITDPNYTGSATGKLVISPAKLTVKAADQTKVYLAAMPALTGSLTGVVNGDGITASYSTTATTNSPVGNYDIVPSLNDPNNRLSNYTVEATNGTLKITKATATVTLANLSQVYDTHKKAVTVTTDPSPLAVDVVYSQNNQAVDPINAGSYHVEATVNDANYQGSATGTLTITRATPVITWNNPAAITYGTALGDAQLNASANVGGNYVYTPASGTKLKAGTGQKLHVNFTPADTANYTGASADVTIDVNKASTAVGVTSSLNPSVYGSSVLFTATVTSVLGDATGSVDFYDGDTSGTKIGSGTVNATTGKATASTATLAAGAHTITAVYVGDANNLGSQNGDLTQQVQKATPVITWSTPAAITYGTALGNTQLNATASVAGNLVYSPAAGTVLSAGASQNLHVDFTPNDTANFNSASADVKIDVNKAPLSVKANSYARPYGTANPALDGTLTGVVAGDGITASYSTTATTNSLVGDYPIVPSLSDPNSRLGNYTVTATNGTLTVTRRSTAIAFAANQSWVGIYAHPSAFSATVTDLVSNTPAANLPVKFTVGTQSVTATTDVNGVARATLILTQAPGPNYTLTAASGQTATLADSSVDHSYSIQQDLSTSMFVSNTGTNLIWTNNTNTSTATVTLNCQLSAWDLGLNKPADPNSYTGDIRYAKVTFGWRNADGSVTPIPGAQNLPVGLVNSADPTVGTASAITQVDLGTAQEKCFTIAMVVSGYYVDSDPVKGSQMHDFKLTVARPGVGNEILGVGAVANCDTQGESNGILQGDRDQCTSFQFDVLYNKSMTNLQGSAKVWIMSHNAYDSTRGQWFIDSVAHCYLVKSNSLAGLQISSPQAQLAAKCTVQDVSPWLSQPVSVDGGAQLTISMKGNQTPLTGNQVAITVQNSKGGLWFSSDWGANGSQLRNVFAVTQPNGSTCTGNVCIK